MRRLSLPPSFALLVIMLTMAAGNTWAAPKKIADLCKVNHPSDAYIAWECRTLIRGDSPLKLFGSHWREVLRFNRIDQRHFKAGVSLKVPRDRDELANFTPLPREYPDAAEAEKFILVDLSEQFLGAYEHGRLRFSSPIAAGNQENPTPTGDFRITAFDRNHQSSLYQIEKTDTPYPMHYGLRFYTSPYGVAYWIHGRDLPGFPASHGCIGLYDEEMQQRYYKNPAKPALQDATILYQWAIGPNSDTGRLTNLKSGPLMRIIASPIPEEPVRRTTPPQLLQSFHDTRSLTETRQQAHAVEEMNAVAKITRNSVHQTSPTNHQLRRPATPYPKQPHHQQAIVSGQSPAN